jgi:hypothetical protein
VTKTDKAVEWVRQHPGANQVEAKKAGFHATMYFKAKRLLKANGAVQAAEQAMATATPPPPPPTALALPPPRQTKVGAAMEWRLAHPTGTMQEAEAAGHSAQNFYFAGRKLRGHVEGSSRNGIEVVSGSTTGMVHSGGGDALLMLINKMRDELGVVELHYRDGELQVVRRQTMRLR